MKHDTFQLHTKNNFCLLLHIICILQNNVQYIKRYSNSSTFKTTAAENISKTFLKPPPPQPPSHLGGSTFLPFLLDDFERNGREVFTRKVNDENRNNNKNKISKRRKGDERGWCKAKRFSSKEVQSGLEISTSENDTDASSAGKSARVTRHWWIH
ncbi:hypothetical protein CEXT_349451 [Caerostris extrusa]|uniref:Uncharacterized protein n=1 Tax=Caerostris extrusa TaxID=172846 RepID=A0AAV4R5Q2_CAEEX|nr:hypothetical protein CEXT_349451 [Caerostris extrusa]